jgi:hypothetical protein
VPDAEVSIWVGLDGDPTTTVEQAGTIAVCGTADAPLNWDVLIAGSPGAVRLPNRSHHAGCGDVISFAP